VSARTYSPKTVQRVALIGVASSSFTITVLSAALADIAEDLGSTVAVVTWVIAAPLLAFAVFTPMAGKLGDIYGHRRMYLIGFTGAAVMSFATSAAWSAGSLIAARVIAQAFSASTGPSALAIIMSVYPEDRRTHIAGTWSAVLAASPAVGVVAGGPLIDLTSWRILFMIQGTGMLVAVALASRVLPVTRDRREHTFDWTGGFLLAIGCGSLLIAINRAADIGWDHPFVIGGLVLSPIVLGLFATYEQRIETPLVSLEVLRHSTIWRAMTSQIFINGPYMAALVLTSVMLASVFDFTTSQISLMILPRPISFAVAAARAGWVVERIGGRATVIIGTLGIALGLSAVGLGAYKHSTALVLIGVGLAGAGNGVCRPPIIAAMTQTMDDADLGVGTGLFNMFGQLGAAAGISILASLVTVDGTPGEFAAVLLLGAALSLIAATIAGSIHYVEITTTRSTPSPTAPYSAVVHRD